MKKKTTPDPVEPTPEAGGAKRNPFATAKPRSEWKRPKRRVRGRVKFDVCVGVDKAGQEVYKLFTASLTSDGLRVHRERARKSSDRVWPLVALANGVNAQAQMEMFYPKKGKA